MNAQNATDACLLSCARGVASSPDALHVQRERETAVLYGRLLRAATPGTAGVYLEWPMTFRLYTPVLQTAHVRIFEEYNNWYSAKSKGIMV